MPPFSVAIPQSKFCNASVDISPAPVMTLANYIGSTINDHTITGIVAHANRLQNSITLQHRTNVLTANDVSINANNDISLSYTNGATVNINYPQLSGTVSTMVNDGLIYTDIPTNSHLNVNGRLYTHRQSDHLNYTHGLINRQQDGDYKTCAFNKTKIETYSDDDDLIITINGQEFYSKDVTIESIKARKFRKTEERRLSLYANQPVDTRRRRGKIISSADFAELKAQETLREFISESEWRRYLTSGFIIVKSQHHQDRVYQIHRDERINVWIKGKMVCKLCIHSNNCPPTDHVIAMKTLAELDEVSLWKGSNIHNLLPEFKHLDIKQNSVYQTLDTILTGIFPLQTATANVIGIRVA